MKMISAAINAKPAPTPTPLQPDMNQPAPRMRAEEIPHHTQISESINGTLTKRRKYSPLSSLPMRVVGGSFGWDNKPPTPCGPLGKIMHFSRYGSTAIGKNRSLFANRRTGSYFFNSSASFIWISYKDPRYVKNPLGSATRYWKYCNASRKRSSVSSGASLGRDWIADCASTTE